MSNNLERLTKYIHNYYNLPNPKLFFFDNIAFDKIESQIVQLSNQLSLSSSIISFENCQHTDDLLEHISNSHSHLIFIKINTLLSQTNLSFFNMHRENFFKCNKLLFIITNDQQINNFIEYAPDLFSWHSSIFS